MQGCCAEVVANPVAVKKIAVCPQGRYFATADIDRNVRIWRKDGGEWASVFCVNLRHPSRRFRSLDIVRDLRFSPDGSRLYVASADTVRSIDTETLSECWQHKSRPYLVFMITTPMAVVPTSDGRVCMCNGDGSMEISCQRHQLRWHDHHCPIDLAVLPCQQKIVGIDRFHVAVWDLETGARLLVHPLSTKAFAMAANPHRPLLALRTLRSIELLDLDSGQIVAETEVAPGLPGLAWSPDGLRIANVDQYGVTLFDTSLQQVNRVEANPESAPPLAVAFDQQGLFVAMSDGSLRYLVV